MIKEYPNGDSVEIKGLTVTVKLGDESMSKIRKAALDEIDTLRDENARLRELIADTMLDPRKYCEKYGIEYEGWDSANAHIDKRMIELGVDAKK